MIWIAPSEKDIDTAALEKRLWDAADQFRANSGLKSQEYSAPVLGLIFLRFAEVRFAAQRAKLEKASASARRGSHLTYVRESSKLRMVERTEIMIARYGASVARICSGLTGAYNVVLAKVIPTVPNCQEFLRQFLSDDKFHKLLIGMSGRAAQNGFNKSDIAAVRVPVPSDGRVLEQFERFAVPIRDYVLALRDKIQNLRRTRDLLLPRLLSGQVNLGEN